MNGFYHKKKDWYAKVGLYSTKLSKPLSTLVCSCQILLLYWGWQGQAGEIREEVVGGPSIVFTRRPVVDETFTCKSQNVCKSFVGIDASQLYPFSMYQPMPTRLYTRYEYDSELQQFKPRQNKTRSFENMVMSYFQRIRPEC